MKINEKTLKIQENGISMFYKMLGTSFLGILLSIIGYYTDPRFLHSYLVTYIFFLTLSLGGLFFVLAHHMFGADWSTSIRRIPENLMLLAPLMLFLSIPIILNFDSLYQWTSQEYWDYHGNLEAKRAYLNKPFFFIRMAIYFTIWFFLISRLYTLSLKLKTIEDKDRIKRTSAAGIALFALTVSFFGFDAIMSLDPSWFSTMFGVYIFSGCFLSAIAFVTLVSLFLRSKGILVDEINEKHYANLGKVLFAFTVFWAYIGGFQYYIIWYGNLPEETYWFIQRWEGPWKYLSIFLIFGHFVIPFFVLIFNRLKRNRAVLGVMSVFFLIVHWIDIYWMVMPNFFRDNKGYIKSEDLSLLSVVSWTDFAIFLAFFGLMMAIFWRLFKSNPIVPSNDPGYSQSISKEES